MDINGTNLAMTRGDTESITVELYDAATEDADRSERELASGDTVTFTVRRERSSEDVVLTKRVTTFNGNAAIISIEHADTCDLPSGSYVYDIEYVTAAGAHTTLVGGGEKPSTFTLYQDVTW